MNEDNGREVLVLLELLKACHTKDDAEDGFRSLVKARLIKLLDLIPNEEGDE